MLYKNSLVGAVLFSVLAIGGGFWLGAIAQAETQAELENKISNHNQEIARLEKEIAAYTASLNKTANTAKTLKGEIAELELTRKKLAADVALTENKIAAAETRLRQLGSDIEDRTQNINQNQGAVKSVLRSLRQLDEVNLLGLALAYNRWSDFWAEADSLLALDVRLRERVNELSREREGLNADQAATAAERARLDSLRGQLIDQKAIVEKNKSSSNDLLKETQNEEATYRRLLAERRAKKDAFEKELFEFESQLRIIIDPTSLPSTGKGTLRWPLADASPLLCSQGGSGFKNCLTQFFGKTVDSRRLYASGSHNGIDFRAPVGTPVAAARTGVVIGAGDTDLICPGASHGKWILLRHDNGLSTLYGHLSLIKTSAGATVKTGEIIGYTGNSGYSTGPHLHLTVYATQGVEVKSIPSKVCRGTYTMPVAPPEAYLDPLIYL